MQLLKAMKNGFLRVKATIPVTVVRILSFFVLLPDGFWAVDGFSRTKSRLLAAFPAQKPEIQEMQGALEMASGKGVSIAKSTILVIL